LLALALLRLATSVAVAIAAQHLYQTYTYWVAFFPGFLEAVSHPEPLVAQIFSEFDNANQEASVLGWVGGILTGLLLALGLIGMWRLRTKAVT
jgi:hypothetical protein